MPLDLFVGRTRELQRYQKLLSKETPWAVIIRGLGGTGKGTLLDELERETPRDTCIVRLDLAQKSLRTDYLTFLENFSLQTESYCDPERTVEFRRSIAKGRYEIGKKVHRGDTEIGEIRQTIDGGDDLDVSDTEFSVEVGDDHIEDTRCQMREISKEKFYAQMKTFTAKRLVIMLDTCEWLGVTKGAEAGQWAVDEVIPGLHSSMQKKGQQCFILMASRVPLHLNCINEKDQEEWKLGMLAKAEAYQCLEQMDIHDPVIQDFIYNMTYGHPHSLSIIHDIWEDRWELSDSPLSISDLPILQGLFYERALQAVVANDVLLRLLSHPFDELTRYGVLLRRFNLPLLRSVFKNWLPEAEARQRFEQFIRYPHVEPLGDFNYAIHVLLREILAGYIRVQEPEKWKLYHGLALDFLTAEAEVHHAAMRSPDWYYHQLAYDEEKGITYWNQIKNSGSQDYIEKLREVARDKTLNLTLATMQCMDIQRDAIGTISR